MKQVSWVLVVLISNSILAAQRPGASAGDAATSGSAAVSWPAHSDSGFIGPMASGEQAASGQRKAKPVADAPPPPMKRTRIDPSMVGYIDDSAVRNEVRLRLDAGFDMPRPDRAEYFYAGSSAPAANTVAVQRTLNFQELYFSGEYAPTKFMSAFVMVPYRWIEPFFVPSATRAPDLFSGGGISDVQAGLKAAAIYSDARNLTFQLRAYFPTGNGVDGFGTNHYSIEPMVLYYQRVSDRTALEAEAGDTHPIGGTTYAANTTPTTSQNFAGDVAMYGVGPSYQLITRDSYRFAPVFELVSWHVFGGLQTGQNSQVQSAAGINVLNAKLGGRISFSNGSSIYAGYGRGLTADIWYRNLFRMEYRREF